MVGTQLKELFSTDIDLARMSKERQQKLGRAIREANVDALLLFEPLDVEYAAGIDLHGREVERPVVLATADDVVHVLEGPEVAPGANPIMQRLDGTWDGLAEQVRDIVGQSAGHVAIDSSNLGCLSVLQDRLGHPIKSKVTDGGADVVTMARLCKTADEIECLRRSNVVVGLAMDDAREVLKPGVTVEQIREAVEQRVNSIDPDGKVVTLAPAVPEVWHADPAVRNPAGEPPFPFPLAPNRPYEQGEVVWNDTATTYYGYHSDYGRTWIVGEEPTRHQADQFNEWIDILGRIVEVLRPGNTVADITAAASAVAGKRNRQPWLSHLFLGHGTGLAAPEYPFVGSDPQGWFNAVSFPATRWSCRPPDGEVELRPGMVLVVEHVVWDEHSGYRGEEEYVITENGAEKISNWSYAPFE